VQSVFPLSGKTAALKLTTSRYYTPSGRSIHRATHGRLLAAGLEERDGKILPEDEDDETTANEAPPSAPADSAPGPLFRTNDGRPVYGGGGIRPDAVVIPDSLPPLTRRVESRGLAFRFANRWINTHEGWTLETALTDELRRDFAAFLEAEKVAATAAELASERVMLDRAVRRELARRLGGDAAAARVALTGDPVFARARAVLSRARTPRGVFAAISAVPEAQSERRAIAH